MAQTPPGWLTQGRGRTPGLAWQFASDVPLAGLDIAAESGAVFAANESGRLYRAASHGQPGSLSTGITRLQRLAWSATGETGVVLAEDSRISLLSDRLLPLWQMTLPEPVLDVAIEPRGQYLAAAMTNGRTWILDRNRRRVASCETVRPLRYLQFLTTEPTLLGAGEYGLLCALNLDGTSQWAEKLWSNAGALSASYDGRQIFLAAFSYGLQAYNQTGSSVGSFVVEGNPNLVSVSHNAQRIAVTTLERQLLLLNGDGSLIWQGELPGDPTLLRCDATGDAVVCGLASGEVLRLTW